MNTAENPPTERSKIFRADADPRIDQCARIVINEDAGPTEAARRVFGNGLTKKDLESKRVNITKRTKSLGGSTVGKLMPVGAVWSLLDNDGYQLCARCGRVIPQFDTDEVPNLVPEVISHWQSPSLLASGPQGISENPSGPFCVSIAPRAAGLSRAIPFTGDARRLILRASPGPMVSRP